MKNKMHKTSSAIYNDLILIPSYDECAWMAQCHGQKPFRSTMAMVSSTGSSDFGLSGSC